MPTIRKLQKGTYFTLRPIQKPEESQVYIRGVYDKSLKKFSCVKFDDINAERLFKGEREVFVDFIF